MTEHSKDILETIKQTCSDCINDNNNELYDFTNNFDNIIIAKEIDKNKVVDGIFDCCGKIIFIKNPIQNTNDFSFDISDNDDDSCGEESKEIYDQDYLNTIDVSFYYTYDVDEGNGSVGIWFPNKSKLAQINFLNYKFHGLREEWFYNGQCKLKCSYDNGDPNYDLQEWHKNGQKSVLQQNIDGTEDGAKTYEEWKENGIRTMFYNYVNGLYHGIYETRYENGNPRILCTYVNGKKHGLYESWHENNVKHRTCYFNNGTIEGIFEEWYNNGLLRVKCNYSNDIEDDDNCEILQSYDRSGNPIELNSDCHSYIGRSLSRL